LVTANVAPSLASRLTRRIFSTPRKFAPRDWVAPFERLARRERLASGLSVLRAGDGPLVALIHESDNSIGSRLILPPKVQTPRRAGWKEVQR
jgi:hypothetical protein